jgi:hypothetical protein
MGQGASYTYTSEEEKAKWYFIPVATEQIVIAAAVDQASLTSTYYGPKDGTNVIFVAPSQSMKPDEVLHEGHVKSNDFHYEIYGGTGKNTYILGNQNATIHANAGKNVIQVPFASDEDRHLVREGFRDDGTCILKLEGITVDSAFFQNAQIGVRHLPQSSDLAITFGKTTIELPDSSLKKLEIRTEDGIFSIHTQELNGAWENDHYHYRSFIDSIGSSRMGYKNLQKEGEASPALNQHFFGTEGSDTFVVHGKSGKTTITDFSTLKDKIEFTHVDHFTNILSRAVQTNNDVVIPLDDPEHALTLQNVHTSSLTLDHFMLAPI